MLRSSTSSACPSGTSASSRVIGPPGMRSTLTIFVWPTRAHSVRICRSVASIATIETRPLFSVTLTSAEAEPAATRDRQMAMASAFMLFILLLSEVIDDLGENLVKLIPGLVIDESFDPGEIRHAPRHVFEPRLVRLIVRNELDGRFRPAEVAHLGREIGDRHFLHVADVDHLTDRLWFGDEFNQCANHVRD